MSIHVLLVNLHEYFVQLSKIYFAKYHVYLPCFNFFYQPVLIVEINEVRNKIMDNTQ